MKEIETQRLILRPFNTGDIDALYSIYSDIDVNKFLPWPLIRTRDEALLLYKSKYENSKGLRYAICLKNEDIPLGYIHIDTNDGNELGYAIKKEYWGKGIEKEACIAVIEECSKIGIAYLIAIHDVENTRSGSVIRKIGMKYQYTYQERWMPKDITVFFRLYLLNLDGNKERRYEKFWNMHPVHFVEEMA